MTDKLWDERPNREDPLYYVTLRDNDTVFRDEWYLRDLDAWTEKVKVELDKLEAVKKWYKYIYSDSDVPLDDFRFPEDSMMRFKKILEGKTLHSIGETPTNEK